MKMLRPPRWRCDGRIANSIHRYTLLAHSTFGRMTSRLLRKLRGTPKEPSEMLCISGVCFDKLSKPTLGSSHASGGQKKDLLKFSNLTRLHHLQKPLSTNALLTTHTMIIWLKRILMLLGIYFLLNTLGLWDIVFDLLWNTTDTLVGMLIR